MGLEIDKKVDGIRDRYNSYVESRCTKLVEDGKTEPVVCLNCGTEYVGRFCPSCGQSAKTKRFSTRETLVHILFMLTKFDGAFWRTTFELFTRPGHMVRDYLDGKRTGYMRPFQMLLCLITAYLIIRGLIFDEVATRKIIDVENVPIFKQILKDEMALYIHQHVNAFMQSMIARTVSSIFVLSLTCFWCFRFTKEGKKINYAEHCYTLIFMNCQIVIIFYVMLGYHFINGTVPSDSVNMLVELFLGVVMYSQLLSMKKKKAIRVFLLAYLLYALILIAAVVILVVTLMGLFGFENVAKIIK